MQREIGNQKSEIRNPSETEERTNDVRSFRDLNTQGHTWFPKMEQYALADQMRRASKSICANIAEGFAKQRSSSAEFRRFMMMAIGSSDEMKVWLDYSPDLGYVDGAQVGVWQTEYTDISRMLHGLIKNWN